MTSTNPYEELARVLDTIPNGYPAVEDGTHIKILEWIFTSEEAELASKLRLSGETAAEISQRLGRHTENIEDLLETMRSKGQVNSWMSKSAGARKYAEPSDSTSTVPSIIRALSALA